MMVMIADGKSPMQAFFVRFEGNSILPKSLKLDFFPLKPGTLETAPPLVSNQQWFEAVVSTKLMV